MNGISIYSILTNALCWQPAHHLISGNLIYLFLQKYNPNTCFSFLIILNHRSQKPAYGACYSTRRYFMCYWQTWTKDVFCLWLFNGNTAHLQIIYMKIQLQNQPKQRERTQLQWRLSQNGKRSWHIPRNPHVALPL